MNPITTHLETVRLSQDPRVNRTGVVGLDRVVLLAGGLKPSPLMAATGRSTLDLPFDTDRSSLLNRWCRQITDRHGPGNERCSVVIAESDVGPTSRVAGRIIGSDPQITSARDNGLRGPAGTVRDICMDLEPDSMVLIVEAMRCFCGDLRHAVAGAIQRASDITVFRHADGSPAGLYVAKAKAIQLIAAQGFIDIKEQWLQQAIARGSTVRVKDLSESHSFPLRTLEDAITAACALRHDEPTRRRRPLEARVITRRTSTGNEPACRGIHSTAIVRDSIVMRGAQIGAHAIVVRSIVCADAFIKPRTVVVDQIVKAGVG